MKFLRRGFVGLQIVILIVLISGLITGAVAITRKDTFNVVKKADYTCNGYCAPKGEGCGGDTCGNGGSCAPNNICCKACSAPAPTPTPVNYTCNGSCFPNGEDCYQRGSGTCAPNKFCCQTATAPPAPSPAPTARPALTPTPTAGSTPTATPSSYSCKGSCFPNGEDCYIRGYGTCATGKFCCLTATAPPTPTPTSTPIPTPAPTPYCSRANYDECQNNCMKSLSGGSCPARPTPVSTPTPTPTPVTITARCWDGSYAPDGDANYCPKKPTPTPTPTPAASIAKSNGLGCIDNSQCTSGYCEGGGYSEGQVNNGICKEKPKPNGTGCTDSSQCISKYCEGGGYSEHQVSNGICKEPVTPPANSGLAEGGSCKWTADCKQGLVCSTPYTGVIAGTCMTNQAAVAASVKPIYDLANTIGTVTTNAVQSLPSFGNAGSPTAAVLTLVESTADYVLTSTANDLAVWVRWRELGIYRLPIKC